MPTFEELLLNPPVFNEGDKVEFDLDGKTYSGAIAGKAMGGMIEHWIIQLDDWKAFHPFYPYSCVSLPSPQIRMKS